MSAHLRYPIILSIIAALVTLGLKSLAYILTGSVGLLSDALESCINLIAALTAYFAIGYSSRPVDSTHTYGHDKIEYFSSGLEGTLIIVAAIGIAGYAIERFVHPAELTTLGIGTILALVASAINLTVAIILLRVGRAHNSIVLEADGQHLMSDVWTSVAVVTGLGLVWWTEILWLDPLVAIVMACSIAWTGFDLVRRSFDGLMDRALPDDALKAIRAVIDANLREGMTFHALRTRQAGSHWFADCHLLVPGMMTVRQAHALMEHIESAIQKEWPKLQITIHVEPIEDRASWDDNQLAAFEP